MNYFAVIIVMLFVFAAAVELMAGRLLPMQIYLASAWLNVIFLCLK